MKHLGEQESFPLFLEQDCIRVTWWVPRQCGKHQAPSAPRAVPEGWGCWSGRHYTPVVRGSLSQFRSWDPPPPGPGWGEPTKRLCSCPGTNGLEAAGSAVSRRHQRPRGSGRGKGDRWRTDRWRQCRALERPIPVPARGLWHQQPQLGTSSQCPHRASPMDAAVSPGDADTAPWTQLRVLAPTGAREPWE